MKNCIKCRLLKPVKDYYVLAGNKDGHFNECKECVKKRVKKRRLENIEYVRAYDRERGHLTHRKQNAKKSYLKRILNPEKRRSELDYKIEYNRKNLIKRNARNLVNNAIRDKKLFPKPCENCAKTEKIHAHHEDYYKPLDVIWLCVDCHGLRHREINEKRRLFSLG